MARTRITTTWQDIDGSPAVCRDFDTATDALGWLDGVLDDLRDEDYDEYRNRDGSEDTTLTLWDYYESEDGESLGSFEFLLNGVESCPFDLSGLADEEAGAR